jgi:hypothetical protein
MRLASYVPGELIPLPLSGSIPELPHVGKVSARETLSDRLCELVGRGLAEKTWPATALPEP